MTVDLDEHYGVTISERGRTAKGYLAVGQIFSRKTMRNVGPPVRGEGRTWPAAAERALAAARQACPLGAPEDNAD